MACISKIISNCAQLEEQRKMYQTKNLDGGTLAVRQEASAVVELWMEVALPRLLVLL